MALDLSLLARAVERLDEVLVRFAADPSDTAIRDGLIQRFEFTFDLAHKTMRRALEVDPSHDGPADQMTFATLIRTADEKGFLAGDWLAWRTYRDMRNITSHTYDEEKALRVVAKIPAFLHEARALLARLRERPCE